MTVRHHIDDSTLLRYASGDLDEAFAVVVAAHLDMCTHCRHSLRLAEDIGGELLEDAEPTPLSEGAFDRILSGLESAGPRIERRAGEAPPEFDVPSPLRRFTGPRLSEIPWSRVAPGIKRHRIALEGAASLFLLHIASGKAVPEHGHGGSEMTLILSGSYQDALGRFATGDIADLDEHVEHQPRVDSEEPCICLVATEMPTRFRGFFSRLLQPLVGI